MTPQERFKAARDFYLTSSESASSQATETIVQALEKALKNGEIVFY